MNQTHAEHPHVHGSQCGHRAVAHEGHTDYLHDGHLHHVHQGQVDEHRLSVNDKNPAECTPDHDCMIHAAGHLHGPSCGHEAVPHGDHVDYIVAGHLHHPCTNHCDDHGLI